MNDATEKPRCVVEPVDLSSEMPQLLEDEIHIWIGLLKSDWTQRLEPKTLLPNKEHKDLSNSAIEAKRQARVIARCLTRNLIGHILQTEPKAVRFTSNNDGKPRIDPSWTCAPVQFNVSHCDEGVAVALTRHRPVGIDIEPADRTNNHEALAKRYFPDADLRVYHEFPPSERQRLFLKTWTQLEATVKAHGEGLALLFRNQIPPAIDWPRFSIPTPSGLVAAVCVQAPAPTRIRVWHL